MTLTRRAMLGACAGGLATLSRLAADNEPTPPRGKQRLGVVIHSYGVRRSDSRSKSQKPPFDDPQVFLKHCQQLGASGIQTGIGRRDKDYLATLRREAEAAGMHLEGIVALPKDQGDLTRFADEIRCAKECGASILRTACLNSRRYETFDTAAAFERFAQQAYESLTLAEPVVAKYDVRLAVENHKDWRVEQLLELLKRLGSRHVGVCVDTGNSIALLEDPFAVVEAYAPVAFTTHVKDMAVAEYDEGVLLSEVPLGTGFLDLKKIVQVLRAKQPQIHLNLEMITRDPLKVPCLTPKYWATFESLPGRHLAEALTRVRKNVAKAPLPRVSALPRDKQVEVEEENVGRSLSYAANQLGS